GPEEGTVLVPNELDGGDAASAGDEAPGTSFRPRLPASSDNTESTPVEPPVEAAPSSTPQLGGSLPSNPLGKQPQGNQNPPQAQQPQHPSPSTPLDDAAGPQFRAQASALRIVEDFRVASGLGAFVAAGDCAQPVVHTVVTVT